MSSSTEKNTNIGRAIARVRDRYRDTDLARGHINEIDYHFIVLPILNEIKEEYRKIFNENIEKALEEVREAKRDVKYLQHLNDAA